VADPGPAAPDSVMDPTAGTAVPAVELSGITKAFPGVVANDHIDLRAMPGEVLCLLGENGAGKSTLMSILSGLYQPDSGTIRIDGELVRIDSPRAGRELGIGMVYQHLSLIPTLSILENLMLGSRDGMLLDVGLARERLLGIADMLGVSVDPDMRVSSLALGQQQHVEIIKALWKGSRVLILDEPTSMLTPQGIEDLQRVLVALKANGIAIIFITHKLHEAIAIGDRITVLRQGRVVGAVEPSEMRSTGPADLQQRIVDIMFGEGAAAVAGVAELATDVERISHQRHVTDTVMLELVGVSAKGPSGQYGVSDVTLTVNGGEILGIAGVDGNGQRVLAEVVAGQRRASAGAIRVEGTDVTALDVSGRQRLGLRYVTDDRLGEGVVSRYSVGLNLVLKRIGQPPYWHRGRIDRHAITATADELIAEFDIRTPSSETPIGRLSGGNIQKALLARELSFGPRVVVFNKPTHGLDVRTIAMVRERIRQLAARGVATLVISTDLDELIDLSDRVAVLFAGRVVGIVVNGPGAEHRIGELIIGGREPDIPEAVA
jgi:ABC-type uncharacterized transport system ATPase subunit